jgi:oxalate decarboxylase/phosphoglucose isomerase-like protein (cupin superfamily)
MILSAASACTSDIVREFGYQFLHVINGQTSNVKSDYAIVVPADARHNIKNTGTTPLQLYTIYAPPEHKDKTIHATKQDAKAKEAHFDGQTSESSD